MAMSKAARNANITKRSDGSTNATISITIKPGGHVSVNGQVRHRTHGAIKDVVDIIDWLDWIHSQRHGKAAA